MRYNNQLFTFNKLFERDKYLIVESQWFFHLYLRKYFHSNCFLEKGIQALGRSSQRKTFIWFSLDINLQMALGRIEIEERSSMFPSKSTSNFNFQIDFQMFLQIVVP
jgi:hypothetical protein